MRFVPGELDGTWLVELEPHLDERGFFARSFCVDEFAEHGLPTAFPQTNLSRNTRAGTLRGMHFNVTAEAEGKLVRCTRGAIHDVVVDLRPDSATYLRSFAASLDADGGRALYVPPHFAHGFVTLTDATDVEYLMTRSYVADAGRGARWDDPAFAIEWPRPPAVISARDATYPDFEPSVLDGP